MKAIEATDLSKTYVLQGKTRAEFCALEPSSFTINEGESVGIIGRNGAGKSTLLKLLSGVTLPSSGTANIYGSFSSLLEVGTGFHPDLSGKDNIYLNASILGIGRKQIASELENIITFSGVGKFIDQPLRTFSSGMRLRLAFAVMAHLQTDIIALDEVLAVGDSMFQIKCMNRIFDFKDQGRTVLFVSHNLSAVRKLCERTLVLDNGKIAFDGPTDRAIAFYQYDNDARSLPSSAYLNDMKIECTPDRTAIQLAIADLPTDDELDIGINISARDGSPLYHFSNRFVGTTLNPDKGSLSIRLGFRHHLKPGRYPVSVYLGQNEQQLEWLENAALMVIPPYSPHGFHNPEAIQASFITEFDLIQL